VGPVDLLLGLVAATLFVGTLVAASIGGRALRRALYFARLALRPERPIGTLDSGPCRITGHALFSSPEEQARALRTPVSARPALWVELIISRAGRPLLRERKSAPGVLRDQSGEIPLELGDASLEVGATSKWRGTLSHELPPGVDASLRARLVSAASSVESTTGLAREGVTLELEERAVYVGQALHVCGTVVRTGPSSSFISTEPVVVSDRAFAEMARRDGLFGSICLAVALAVVGALTEVGSVLIAHLSN
jgi:hypothetical protein